MKCPGQDSRYWKPGAIFEARCPKCGNPVEFFKDDTTRTCRNCGHRFLNPSMDFGCAAYCPYAEQCIGNLPSELVSQKEDLLKDRVAIEVKRYFGRDFKRIGHALRTARYAEEIGRGEGGNLGVIIVAAYLHDVGLKKAEEMGLEDGAWRHGELGVGVAREILERLGGREELVEAVLAIVRNHHDPGDGRDLDFRCVYDADRIVNLEEALPKGGLDPGELERQLDDTLLTPTGRSVARRVLMREETG